MHLSAWPGGPLARPGSGTGPRGSGCWCCLLCSTQLAHGLPGGAAHAHMHVFELGMGAVANASCTNQRASARVGPTQHCSPMTSHVHASKLAMHHGARIMHQTHCRAMTGPALLSSTARKAPGPHPVHWQPRHADFSEPPRTPSTDHCPQHCSLRTGLVHEHAS